MAARVRTISSMGRLALDFRQLGLLALVFHGALFVQLNASFHYFRFDSISLISFRGDDGVGVHCGEGRSAVAIGHHCFGDYAQVRNGIAGEVVPIGGYPGLGNFFHWLAYLIESAFSSYVIGLGFYLLMLFLALSVPWIILLRVSRISILEKFAHLFSIGPLSIPALIVIDRGNSAGFLVPFISIYVLGLLTDRKHLVLAGAVLAALIKPQFVILGLIFIYRKDFKFFLITISAWATLSLAPYLVGFENFSDRLREQAWVLEHASSQSLDLWEPVNISLARTAPILFPMLPTPTADVALLVSLGLFISLSLSILFFRGQLQLSYQVAVLVVGSAIGLPVSYPYYAVVFLPLLFFTMKREDLLVNTSLPEESATFSFLDVAYSYAMLSSIVAIIIPWQGSAVGFVSTSSFLPLFWAVFLISLLLSNLGQLVPQALYAVFDFFAVKVGERKPKVG